MQATSVLSRYLQYRSDASLQFGHLIMQCRTIGQLCDLYASASHQVDVQANPPQGFSYTLGQISIECVHTLRPQYRRFGWEHTVLFSQCDSTNAKLQCKSTTLYHVAFAIFYLCSLCPKFLPDIL